MTKLNLKTGIIGAGNMGEAFAGAMIKAEILSPSMIILSDINQLRLDFLNKKYGILTTTDNVKLFLECDVVLLAVKPQQIKDLLEQITLDEKYSAARRKIIISIAAGIPICTIENFFYASLDKKAQKNFPVIRVMPNTPSLVLRGMSGMSLNKNVSKEDCGIAVKILAAMGKVIQFEEKALDAVTALSGSGPAYVFYLIESMVKGGVKLGLDPKDAFTLTLSTLKGAVALIEELKESPEVLRQKVTSPGGTTEAAIKVFEEKKVKDSIVEAMTAASTRSKELVNEDVM